MKHVHAELIKRWADDTSLVILSKLDDLDWARACNQVVPPWCYDVEYFLVCKRHVDIALHWLNGGSTEYLDCNGDWRDLKDFSGDNPTVFSPIHNYRAKAKTEKVKVWVGALKQDGVRSFIVWPEDPKGVCWVGDYTWSIVEVEKEI